MKTIKKPIFYVGVIVVVLIVLGMILIKKNELSGQNSLPQPTDSQSETLKVNATLPKGWTEDKNTDEIIVKSGEYSLSIGQKDTGLARCDEYYNPNIDVNLQKLTNKFFGSTFFRQTPESGLTTDNGIKMDVCSDINSDGKILYGTKAGDITYLIPVKYDPDMLKQMDSMVESISF